MAQIYKFLIKTRKIVNVDKTLNDIDIPEYYFDDDTTIYNIESFIRVSLEDIYNNFSIKIMKNSNSRIVKTNDDDIFNEDIIYSIFIKEDKGNNIPNELKTGNNLINEEKELSLDNIILECQKSIGDLEEFCDLSSKNTDNYIGDVKDNLPDGYGIRKEYKLCYLCGQKIEAFSQYDGMWTNGKFHGFGIFTYFKDSTYTDILYRYEGIYNNGIREGAGKFFDYQVGILEGVFINDVCSGQVKMIYNNGDIYDGGWKSERRNGLGKITYKNGQIMDYMWINDKPRIIKNEHK